MEERAFLPGPRWCLPNILSCREDGSICYGSKNYIVILSNQEDNKPEIRIIQNNAKVTSVAFSPPGCSDSIQNTVASCSDDGLVKLWSLASLSACICHKSHSVQKDTKCIVSLDWSRANPHHIFSIAENNSLVLWDVIANSTKKYLLPIQSPTAVACCPFNEKLVAIGSKAGKIFIVDLTGNGSLVFKLRGHDNRIHSLSWCPVPYNVFKPDELHEEFLLASACQDREVLIWRAGSDGKCEAKFAIPTSSLSTRPNGHFKSGSGFSFFALLWSDPYRLFSSSNFGELIYLDVRSYVQKTLNGSQGSKSGFFKLGHCFHSKTLVALGGEPMRGHIVCDEDVKPKPFKFKIECNGCSILTTDGNTPNDDFKWRVVLPEAVPLIWTYSQDRLLVGCKINSQLEMVHSYHTLAGSAYSAVVSPHDPNKIAIGVGDGMIRLWNLTDVDNAIGVYWQKIKDRVMSLAWHPTKDGLLAYGTSEGRVGLIDTNSKKLPSVFKPFHSSPVYNLTWGPKYCREGDGDASKSEYSLYCIGNFNLFVYNPSELSADPVNLSNIIGFPCKKQTDVSWKPDYSLLAVGNDDGRICLVDRLSYKIVYTLTAYKKLIESIAWHPASTLLDTGTSSWHGLFTSGSTDNSNTVLVFNCLTKNEELSVEVMATLKGHHGYVHSVSWSPHANGRLLSCSADFSVQIWDVFSQSPLINFSPRGMPMFSIWSPVDPDVIITGCKEDFLRVWRISAQTKVMPSLANKPKKSKPDKEGDKNVASQVCVGVAAKEEAPGEASEVAVAVDRIEGKAPKGSKLFSKAWKESADVFQNCYSMLKKNDEERNFTFFFLCDEQRYSESLSAEEESLKKSNNLVEHCELSVLTGNLKEVLEDKIKTGRLNDFLVSVAPVVSPRVWQEACLSYSKTLAEKQQFRKAATYLIACRKVYEAIDVLAGAKLYSEALCVARSRLPKSDPTFKDLVSRYAEFLSKTGSFSKACECYIYLGDYLQVAKICARKKRPEYGHLAALAAKKCGETQLESLEGTRALLDCLKNNNFELAQTICDDLSDLKHLRLLYHVYHTMHQLDTGDLVLSKDIISYVKESFGAEEVIFPPYFTRSYNKYTYYKNKEEVSRIVAQELSFACSSRNPDDVLTHVIRALSTCCRFTAVGGVHPMFSLCTWLSPGDLLSENGYFSFDGREEKEKVKSLRAFLAAGISKKVTPDNVLSYVDVVDEIKNDFLDEASYRYFKNLIEVAACEKRMVYKRFVAGETKRKSRNDAATNGFDAGDEGSETDAVGGARVDSFGVPETLERSSEETAKDADLLKKLNDEIANFEAVRIASPNPVPVYFAFRQTLDKVSENEVAKRLLDDLQGRWNELN